MPRELNSDLKNAIEYYGDQAQTGEILMAPGVVMVLGIRNTYWDLGQGRINVQANTWLDIDEARAEIAERKRIAEASKPIQIRWR